MPKIIPAEVSATKNYRSWSPCYSDLFAAGYGSFDFYSQSEVHLLDNDDDEYDDDDNDDEEEDDDEDGDEDDDDDDDFCRVAILLFSPSRTRAGQNFSAQLQVESSALIFTQPILIW